MRRVPIEPIEMRESKSLNIESIQYNSRSIIGTGRACSRRSLDFHMQTTSEVGVCGLGRQP